MSSKHAMRDKKGRFCKEGTISNEGTLYVDGKLVLLRHVPYHQEYVVQGYKGFHDDMTCKGVKYHLNISSECAEPVEMCKKGIHYCRHPLSVFNFYPPRYSIYAKVDALNANPDTFTVPDTVDMKEVTNWIMPTKMLSLSDIAKEVFQLCPPHLVHIEPLFLAESNVRGGVAAPSYSVKRNNFDAMGIGVANAMEHGL